jgi:hypothetical protein
MSITTEHSFGSAIGSLYHTSTPSGFGANNVLTIDSAVPVSLGANSITGYRGPRRSGVINPCVHTRSCFIPKVVKCVWVSKDIAGYKKTVEAYVPGSLSLVGDTSIAPSAYDAAMQDMMGEIPTDVLMPNLIMELPQTLTLWKQLRAAFTGGTKNWNDAGLAYSFGVKPLFKDLSALFTMRDRVRKRLRHLSSVSDAGYVPFNRSYPVDKTSLNVTWRSTSLAETRLANVIVRKEVYADASIFAQVRRTRTINQQAEMSAALLDASGWTKAGSVLWEAIPFSFVADWFHPFGRALEVLNASAFHGALIPRRIGSQAHLCATVEVLAAPKPLNTDGLTTPPSVCIGRGMVSTYIRGSGLPVTRPSSNYGARQMVLSGMLAYQRA